MPDPKPADPKLAPCPICRRPADPRLRPFCSARCADIDLGRWFAEDYRVAAEPVSVEEDDE